MLFDMPECGGCRTCELACSFHHIKQFNPAVSSFKILDKEDNKGFHVLFIEEGDGIPCDGCEGSGSRPCLDVCKKREELERMIETVLAKRETGKST